MHLLQNIFIIENMELKLENNWRIFKNYSFDDFNGQCIMDEYTIFTKF